MLIKPGTLFKYSSEPFDHNIIVTEDGGTISIPNNAVVMFLEFHWPLPDVKILYETHVCYMFSCQLKEIEIG